MVTQGSRNDCPFCCIAKVMSVWIPQNLKQSWFRILDYFWAVGMTFDLNLTVEHSITLTCQCALCLPPVHLASLLGLLGRNHWLGEALEGVIGDDEAAVGRPVPFAHM